MLFQISVTGIHELVKNCPSLNVLNLSECQSIDDKAVKDITTNVRMLKELYIDRCYKLTDHSLDSIALECKYIKVSRKRDILIITILTKTKFFLFRFWTFVVVVECALNLVCD